MIYPAVHSMERNGALKSRRKTVGGRTRVYYSVTAKGRRRLKNLADDWRRIQGGIDSALGTPVHGHA